MELGDAAELAGRLFGEHGLIDWRFGFDRSVRRLGVCHYDTRTITLSRAITLLNDEAVVRETLLHEIAHALAGPGAHHGPAWQRTAARLGASTNRLAVGTVAVPPRYVGRCPGGHTFTRHRLRCSSGFYCVPCTVAAGEPAYITWVDTAQADL